MKSEITVYQQKQSRHINRFAYILYLVLVIYLLIQGDYEWAFTNLGIALIFDPFDSSRQWKERPFYQKLWLVFHLSATIAGFLYLLTK